MTGGQEHAGTGKTLQGDARSAVNLPELCRSLGVAWIHEVDAYDYKGTYDILKQAVEFDGVSVVIARRPCCLFPTKIKGSPFQILKELCTGCGSCLKIYCPSILLSDQKTSKGLAIASIDPYSCTGCSFCAQVCPKGAIVKGE
jgi:indolepyruvate ferredoxin oxidoreductase alpha subunit